MHNGDIIELGGVQLRFSLNPTRHSGLALREAITWLSIALLCAAQAVLIYLLT